MAVGTEPPTSPPESNTLTKKRSTTALVVARSKWHRHQHRPRVAGTSLSQWDRSRSAYVSFVTEYMIYLYRAQCMLFYDGEIFLSLIRQASCYTINIISGNQQIFRISTILSSFKLIRHEAFILCSPEQKANGELIVYQSSRRLCVCVSFCVCSHFQT